MAPKKRPPSGEEKAGKPIYCTCRKPDDGLLMVGCDGCPEWFHAACIGLEKIPKSWLCPWCSAEQAGKPDADATAAANNNGTKTRTWPFARDRRHCCIVRRRSLTPRVSYSISHRVRCALVRSSESRLETYARQQDGT